MTAETTPQFADLGLSIRSLDTIKKLGWTSPTPIQVRAIPPAMEGKDVIGCAATGTGKTGAFLLPMLEKLPVGAGCKALVLAPTRELAVQIADQLDALGRGGRVRGATIIGGVGMEGQTQALREGREVIIATPGRLCDHLDRGSAKLNGVLVLVLDEADRMLDMGFKPQLERILKRLPPKRQTLLFSATMASEVADFAKTHLKTPVRVEVARSGTTASRATQRVFRIQQTEKTALLVALLAEDDESTLIFSRTKRRADKICRSLERANLSVTRIHADRSQGQRRAALEGFRDGKFRILVATDIAARGIDVEEIGHVVNYDLPHVPEDYVHRIGRTARASASGRASSFCSPEEEPLLRDIEKLIRAPIPRAEVPRSSPAFAEELSRRTASERDPGPDSPLHGISSRPRGDAPGRHARAHPKKPRAAQQGEESPRPSAGAGPGRSMGSWRPTKRHS